MQDEKREDHMRKRFQNYFVNLLMPSFVFGSVTGIVTAVVICFYKLCAVCIIDISEHAYQKGCQRHCEDTKKVSP